ncbi:MAG: hypothetical protein ACKO7B_13080, partial [Flavobacteriales bacterium]
GQATSPHSTDGAYRSMRSRICAAANRSYSGSVGIANDLPLQFKPLAQLLAWLKGGIFMAILSLICAAFIRRKETINSFTNA